MNKEFEPNNDEQPAWTEIKKEKEQEVNQEYEPKEIIDFKEKVISKIYSLEDKNKEEKEILSDTALEFIEILNETELPNEFEIRYISSSANRVVEEKMQSVMDNLGITNPEIILSNTLTKDYPVNYERENLEKAPWVNMVHAWERVLNSLNTVSSIQMKEGYYLDGDDINDLVSTTLDFVERSLLFKDSDSICRRITDLQLDDKYSETRRREHGEKGVNPTRKINKEEMSYILEVVKDTFKKK